jgi:hypothetical protein
MVVFMRKALRAAATYGWLGVLPFLVTPLAAQPSDIDSEHLFGFTEGSDIGAKGEKELELELAGGFGKRGGTYSALSQTTAGKFTILDQFRIAPAVTVDHHHIRGVPGLDDRNQLAFAGVAFEMKYRVLDRHQAPFGLTIAATPNWRRVDEASGEPVDSYGASFLVAADRELVAERLFAAVNLTYGPAASRSRVTGAWERESSLGVSTALAAQVAQGVFVGGEVRYERAYDSIGFAHFAGHALFVGPSIYAKLAKTVWIQATWNAQVAGRAADDPGALDLSNFERHQAKVRVGIGF